MAPAGVVRRVGLRKRCFDRSDNYLDGGMMNTVSCKCYDCGKTMVPEAMKLSDLGVPDIPAGKVINGQIWVRCPDGHRGGWRDVLAKEAA